MISKIIKSCNKIYYSSCSCFSEGNSVLHVRCVVSWYITLHCPFLYVYSYGLCVVGRIIRQNRGTELFISVRYLDHCNTT